MAWTMPDFAIPTETVPGRACGSCNICCIALTIDDPELHKPQGFRCRHNQRDNLCGIYESRPQTCREFHCGWMLLRWVKISLRPDQSRVLIRLRGLISPEDGTRQLGIEVALLDKSALRAEGLAETIAAAVVAGMPVFLRIPGPPGLTSASARVNDVLEQAVLTRDKAEVMRILRRAYAEGRRGDFVPITFPLREDS